MFMPEEVPLLSYESVEQLEQAFKQKPLIVPLAPRPREVVLIKREQDWVPIIAIVGLLGFFGLLAFFAYVRKS